MSNPVTRLRDARNWFNEGKCCGQVDSVGTCAAPACIFGEALTEFFKAADLIQRYSEALSHWQSMHPEEEIKKLESALQKIAYRTKRAHPQSETGEIHQIAITALTNNTQENING